MTDGADISGLRHQESAGTLDKISHQVRELPTIQSLLKDDWFDTVRSALEHGGAVSLNEIQLFRDLEDRGIDVLRRLEPRLSALRKHPDAHRKLVEIRKHLTTTEYSNYLFEANVLGLFAQADMLLDIDYRVGNRTVDARVLLAGIPTIVEATAASNHLSPPTVGYGSDLVDAATYKIRKKAGPGGQLALSQGHPTILFLARRWGGLQKTPTEVAVRNWFEQASSSKLSAVAVSDSWRLDCVRLYRSEGCETPLSDDAFLQLSDVLTRHGRCTILENGSRIGITSRQH